ncbi:alpha/beta-hydrolase [Exidia glandulosa HHB12029]|uniref:Alpha/beta-hydrolase n=1 Tax=Exidia glandulosa HHB12029 TaxID=1314781 RepID=A0A165QLR4_EXIGL|nr:alpha/beta-hydrolase [Exidia glandulosa HHB12029]
MATERAPNNDDLEREIQLGELQRLTDLNVQPGTFLPVPNMPTPARKTYFELLKAWTTANIAVIQEAVEQRGFGGPFGSRIDWKCAFLAFLQSTAIYLRDEKLVSEAVEAYQRNDREGALRLYASATDMIQEIAKLWGLNFVVVCNLVEKHPDGHAHLVGPYCGAFYKSTSKPFISFTFKGTTTAQEWLNDFAAIFPPVKTPPGFLYETTVSRGFYIPIFSTFDGVANSSPFDMMVKTFNTIARTTPPSTQVMTHCTGHSLGAAYASLSYDQFTSVFENIPGFALGDLYTFGSPRVGHNDFAKAFQKAVKSSKNSGSSWRIVNNRDIVADVPLKTPIPGIGMYVHVDCGLKIYPQRSPTPLDSEIGVSRPRNVEDEQQVGDFSPPPFSHLPPAYYDSLFFALTGNTRPRTGVQSLPPIPHTPDAYYDSVMSALNGQPREKTAVRSLMFIEAITTLGGAPGLQRHIDTSTEITSIDLNSFPESTEVTVRFEGTEICSIGTIYDGSHRAELLVWGDASSIHPDSASLHYHSWERLTDQETEVSLFLGTTGEFGLAFTAGGVQLAALVITSSVDASRLSISGKCAWS